jgi:hypothetical protein
MKTATIEARSTVTPILCTITDRSVERRELVLTDEQVAAVAPRLRRGATYAFRFLRGRAAVSGADLEGRAREYSGRYATTRGTVITHVVAECGPLVEVIGANNRRSLWSITAALDAGIITRDAIDAMQTPATTALIDRALA